ncbi:ATP-grasp fold amidoligase family protein [Thalassobacillus devorans]|uniref:ATP-grasp fold amidoligase family protein n=1 Tax=Thalassobacillus devorans TaxID=279813 RepID=UPI000A1CA9A1|nr:ATP-grasp fold amidoligase family protein [Thalassobacillus devorans]
MTDNHDQEKQQTSPQGEEQAYLKHMIQVEAEVAKKEQELKQNHKEIKQLQQSKAWKYTAPLRKIKALVSRITGNKEEADKHLLEIEQETKQVLQRELEATKEQLAEVMLDDRYMKSHETLKVVKEQKQEGKLLEYITKLVQQKRQHETNYNEALRYAARTWMNDKPEYRKLAYREILEGFQVEEIPEFLIREGLTDNPIPLTPAASYRASLNMRMRKLQLTGALPEMLLDEKQAAYQFMKQMNVRVPWTTEETYRLKDIPEKTGIVIKPANGAGSRGVYLVYALDDIIDVKRLKKLERWGKLKETMQKDLQSGMVEADSWYMEELILENKEKKTPASDIKFYCFYGKVGLILEIIRYPELKYCWWTADGERVKTGKYEDDPYKGKGVTVAEIELAAEISTEIPAPFIRIDFLKSEEGLVFGEFTPKPGNYDEFDERTDRWLGDLFLEAESRLTEDLVAGKKFSDYEKLKENLTP